MNHNRFIRLNKFLDRLLQVQVFNVLFDQNGAPTGGLWAGLLGSLSLSDTNFQFSNGTQSLLTNTTAWVGNYVNGNYILPQPWTAPTGAVYSEGQNDNSGTPSNLVWYGLLGGPISGIDGGATWIWAVDAETDPTFGACQICTVDFMTTITPTATPLPAALPLFATGAGMIGLIARRRKRKVQASV